MRRTLLFLTMIPVVMAAVPACRERATTPIIRGTGTVAGRMAECSSWYLKADDGRLFEAIDLPEQVKSIGLRVRFTVRTGPFASTCMRGETVQVIAAVPL